MKERIPFVTDEGNKTRKRTKKKNENRVKTRAHVIALICSAMGGGRNARGQDRYGHKTKTFLPEPGEEGSEL